MKAEKYCLALSVSNDVKHQAITLAAAGPHHEPRGAQDEDKWAAHCQPPHQQP